MKSYIIVKIYDYIDEIEFRKKLWIIYLIKNDAATRYLFDYRVTFKYHIGFFFLLNGINIFRTAIVASEVSFAIIEFVIIDFDNSEISVMYQKLWEINLITIYIFEVTKEEICVIYYHLKLFNFLLLFAKLNLLISSYLNIFFI